ncbi:MAG: type II toxin-antitoxin system YafQ family toxin [Acetatifactor sp.]|nr:type II toxin-antitoxin system YafQ family toxin [Acetatifactor sp.]
MLEIVPSNQFKKDLKLAKKRGFKIEHLRDVVNMLAREQKLDEKYL